MIKRIPPEIGDLKNLTVLSVKGNLLEGLPNEICLLVKLQRLYLSNNKIKMLPDLFRLLKKLTDLDLRKNEFDEFPEVICALTGMKHLSLADNYFDSIPKDLRKLRSLITMNMIDTIINNDNTVLSCMFWCNILGYDNISRIHRPISLTPPVYPVEESNPVETPYFLLSLTNSSKIHDDKNNENLFQKSLLNDDDDNLEDFLRNRASSRITAKLRRRKGKRSSMTSPVKPDGN